MIISREEILILGTTDILDFLLGGHPVHYSMFSNIHGLNPLDAIKQPPIGDNQKYLQTMQNQPELKTTSLGYG